MKSPSTITFYVQLPLLINVWYSKSSILTESKWSLNWLVNFTNVPTVFYVTMIRIQDYWLDLLPSFSTSVPVQVIKICNSKCSFQKKHQPEMYCFWKSLVTWERQEWHVHATRILSHPNRKETEIEREKSIKMNQSRASSVYWIYSSCIKLKKV